MAIWGSCWASSELLGTNVGSRAWFREKAAHLGLRSCRMSGDGLLRDRDESAHGGGSDGG